MNPRGDLPLLLGFAALCAVTLALVGRDLDRPGLYYDEVIQAEPAVQLLAPDGEPPRIPGARSVRVLGRWLPVTIQPYMGALKSQLLVPGFAVFGPTASSLRLSTLMWSLAGLLLVMLWARRVLSPAAAHLAGAVVALDPSFLFISRHDWGSFALGLLLRGGALLLLTTGWAGNRSARLFAGGLCLGLGLYNKLDFALFVGAAALAVAVARPATLSELRAAPRRGLAVGAGALLGAAPVLVMAADALGATGRVFRRDGDWAEKFASLGATFDGSYFHRLMLAGGDFRSMASIDDAAAGPFALLFAASALFLAVRLWQAGPARDRGALFVLATALLVIAGIVATPRAVRVHHVLNAWPFPQLVVAVAVVELWRLGAGRARPLYRAAAVAVVVAALGGSLHVDLRTLETIRATGGKGRWSDAVARFAGDLAARPGAVAVSLDWGFDGPIHFAEPGLAHLEPFWRMRRNRARMRPGAPPPSWDFRGTSRHAYLAFGPDLAVYDFGPAFLERVRSLPEGRATITRHEDRTGDLSFYSVRFAGPHRLHYRDGWEIELE